MAVSGITVPVTDSCHTLLLLVKHLYLKMGCRGNREISVHVEKQVLLDVLDYPDTMLFQLRLERW